VREAVTVHGLWLRMTHSQALPRLHFGLLGLRPRGFTSNPNRKGGSVSARPMASRDAHSSAPSFTLRVTGPAARWLVTRSVSLGWFYPSSNLLISPSHLYAYNKTTSANSQPQQFFKSPNLISGTRGETETRDRSKTFDVAAGTQKFPHSIFHRNEDQRFGQESRRG
jgi:hypothetical protein